MPSKIERDAREMPQTCCLQRDPPQGYYTHGLATVKDQSEECVASSEFHTFFSQVRHLTLAPFAWLLSARNSHACCMELSVTEATR